MRVFYVRKTLTYGRDLAVVEEKDQDHLFLNDLCTRDFLIKGLSCVKYLLCSCC